MRWLFLILLGSNLALFVWFQQEQARRAQLSERGALAGIETEKLLLLSELEVHMRPRVDSEAPRQGDEANGKRTGVASSASAAVTGTAAEMPVTALRCYSVYGFADGPAAQDFIAKLPAGIEAQILPKMSSSEGYWVYVRSPEASAERQAMLETLQRQGLEVSVIARGELRGHLSLGHYQQYDLAYALFQALHAEGYNTGIHEVAAVDPGYAVGLAITDPQVQDQDWRVLLTASDQHLKNEKKSCEGVATKQAGE